MHVRGLFLFTLLLPGSARRSIRIVGSHHGAQQQHLEVSAETRDAFLPRRFGTARLPRPHGEGPHARAMHGRPRSVTYGGLDSWRPFSSESVCRRATAVLHGASDSEEDQLPPKEKIRPAHAVREYEYMTRVRAKRAAEEAAKGRAPVRTHVMKEEETRRCIECVQRFVRLEEVYAELHDLNVSAGRSRLHHYPYERKSTVTGESFFDAVAAGGGADAMTWAAAAGLTVAELKLQLKEGHAARERIVAANLGLVHNRLHKFQRSSGGKVDRGLTDEDLIQEGCLGLLRAAERFDLARDIRFSTYATTSIWHALQRAVYEQSRVVRLPHGIYQKYRVIKATMAAFSLETGREATDDELSAELLNQGRTGKWVSPVGIRSIRDHIERRPASLDVTSKVDFQDTGISRIATIGGARPLSRPQRTVEDDVELNLLHDDLLRIMHETLEPEERNVLSLRFGLENGQRRTIPEICAYIGENQPHRQIHNTVSRGLRKMRTAVKHRMDYRYLLEDCLSI